MNPKETPVPFRLVDIAPLIVSKDVPVEPVEPELLLGGGGVVIPEWLYLPDLDDIEQVVDSLLDGVVVPVPEPRIINRAVAQEVALQEFGWLPVGGEDVIIKPVAKRAKPNPGA